MKEVGYIKSVKMAMLLLYSKENLVVEITVLVANLTVDLNL